ncbi:MAG: bifunctional precorrin-2 dehydrogenase/sirohydrochlorin ferrochelatase [Syntrophaceae bacterium]|nr:bifunctional precorrin-2 dehydrogenase/sirohydrochlorin ferrochelatase [Syntrophaceae bacterium]
MAYYPVNLDIAGRRCVVVGGGQVAERKVERLVECGARVAVLSRRLTDRLAEMARAGTVEHIDSEYEPEKLGEAMLVIGATDREDVNDAVSRECRRRGILVNIVDDPERCDFILPSILQRGDLMVAVSTGGRSPALAKRIREDLEECFGPEYAVLLEIMAELRRKVTARGRSADENKVLFESVVHSEVLDRIRTGDWEGVRTLVRELTGEEIDARP